MLPLHHLGEPICPEARFVHSPMLRFVLLKHTAPDGAWHFDWMIETRPSAGPDDRSLLTFRTSSLPTESAAFDARRIADHRAHYLDFEGDLGQARGRVDRIAAGQAAVQWTGNRLLVQCMTRDRHVRLEGVSHDGMHFHFDQRTRGD